MIMSSRSIFQYLTFTMDWFGKQLLVITYLEYQRKNINSGSVLDKKVQKQIRPF